MSGNDDMPDYLRGVSQTPPGAEPRKKTNVIKAAYVEDDEDEFENLERRPLISPILVIGVVGVFSLLCVGALGSVVLGGSMVDAAQTEAVRHADEMSRVVQQEGKVIDAIASHGGDRRELQRLFDAIEPTEGLQRGLDSLVFSNALEEQFIEIGDVRGTPLDQSREKMVQVSRVFESAIIDWEHASSGILGGTAVSLGLATPPPER